MKQQKWAYDKMWYLITQPPHDYGWLFPSAGLSQY
jgi:hypothetical protein